MTHPGDGQGGWGGQQGGWGQPQYPPTGGFPAQQPQYPPTGDFPAQQPQYPPTGGFPAQQSQYGGLGVYSGGPPEQPKRPRWPIIVAVVVLVLAAGGATTYFLTRESDDQAVTTSTSKSAPPTSSAPTSSSKAAQTCEPHATGWTCLPVPALSYSYDTPEAWKASKATGLVEGLPDLRLTGVATYGEYDCGGKGYNRGNTGGAVVKQDDAGALAKDVAAKLSAQYYKSGTATVAVGEPRDVTVPGTKVTGVQVDSVITTTGNECLASKGAIKVLVLRGDNGLHLFMTNGDLEGGPASAPKPVPDADLQAMVDSVKPLRG
ncbi:hypothetical protein ACFFQW_46330 [Umezawaea endophytica]|uniref:DUF8017 domain-containing protein n=1 Tax=Umezawaea endophytica TaxID=1654476 RepID=A0A9X2VTI5_9PSEU|nr:hypothetical protein [Umezawaea endophytica]MCS7482691.1 hypothetical protein [Umezawaea endophytica]